MSRTPFCFCPLASGSSGNITYVGHGASRFLIDCGKSGRTIAALLDAIGVEISTLRAILLTHSHWDHVCGAGVVSRRFDLPVYATQETWADLDREGRIGKIAAKNRREFSAARSFCAAELDTVEIDAFSLPHDAPGTVSYRVTDGRVSAAVVTDLGHPSEEIRAALRGVSTVLLESNHDVAMLKDGPYPWPLKNRILGDYGHLSNDTAGVWATELIRFGTTRIYLGHLSHENNAPHLAANTVKKTLRSEKIDPKRDVVLEVAQRDAPSTPMRSA